MAFPKALLCAGLLFLAVTAAGASHIKNSGDVWAKQKQYQSSENDAEWNSGPVNQQSSNQGIQQAGNGNDGENDNDQTIEGRRLLGDSYDIDNSGNVWAKQGQWQSSTNDAEGNSGPVNQQSSNQGIQQAGNGNSASNYNKQKITGPQPPKPPQPPKRRLQGWYTIDNSGNVWAKQKQYQSSSNVAKGNSGPVNQQSSNQAIQQAGNGNEADNYNDQTIEGRRLLGDTYTIDNSGNVWAKQSQSQSSTNDAEDNDGPVNQQSSNQGIQQAGNGNSAENYNKQKITGPKPPKPPQPPKRRLLGDIYYIDNSGNVWAKQKQSQSSTNDAEGNSGPINQQSSNQGIQQAGNGNSASNYNKQKITGPEPPKPPQPPKRRLLGDSYYIDNSGNVWAKQGQWQSSTNDAEDNDGPVNQQSSNQGIQQAGNGNDASNYNKQKITGPKPPKPPQPPKRRLLDDYTITNSGDVTAKQSQSQSSTNDAEGNSGPVNQQSSNQGIQQAGNGNSAGNWNKQKITGPKPPKPPQPPKRRLLDDYTITNSGDVTAKQSQSQSSTNDAEGNSGPVNQQSSNQGIQQAGNGNSATNYNKQKITGPKPPKPPQPPKRRLLGWYHIDNHGDVWAKQSQSQSSTNYASGNSGPVNQQSSNQAIQQAGNGNEAENDNYQTIEG